MARLLLAVAGLCVGLAVGEGLLRLGAPRGAFGAAEELAWMRGGDLERIMMVDPGFGFRPILGSDVYSEYGTLRNGYALAKPSGVARVLFVGDSVTARGRLVDALADRYGREDIEYWNAGVESFNTVQQVAFYLRYNAAIEPDHVVLTFHLNDYQTTPIAFRNPQGELVVYAPHRPLRRIRPWLFRYSHLYRLWVGGVRGPDFHALAREAEDSLRRLRDELRAERTGFTVLVLPLMQDPEHWRAREHRARRRVLEFLAAEEIRHFDLLPPLRAALRRGAPLQETRGDPWHPSPELARAFAEHLAERGLLD